MTISTLLTTAEVADLLKVSKKTLIQDRATSRNIPFIRILNKSIRYKLEDIQHYLLKNTHTAEVKAGARKAVFTF